MTTQNTPLTLVVASSSGRMIISPDRVPCIAETYGDNAEEHARRLVSCWNAFHGTSTLTIESMTKPVHEVLFDAGSRMNAAIAQRDKLLTAMERIEGLSMSMFATVGDMAAEGSRIASAAVAEAKGVAA